MHLSLHAVACTVRTKNSGVQGRRARRTRYAECANVVCFDLAFLSSRFVTEISPLSVLTVRPTKEHILGQPASHANQAAAAQSRRKVDGKWLQFEDVIWLPSQTPRKRA